MDQVVLERAARLIAGSEAVMLFGHQWPDGDAIGSVLGLAIALAAAGHRVQASWPEPLEIPHKYSFMPGQEFLVSSRDLVPVGLVIALDCANADRLEELKGAATGASGLVNIDHHPDNTLFGSLNIVDPGAAATSEIIYCHAAALGLELNIDTALCLYAGLVTDTGRFQFANTTARTLRAASELVALGVEPNAVYENIFQSDSLAYMRLTGEVLSRAVYDESLGLIYGCVLQADLASYGVEMNETEKLIDDLRALKGHRVAALFKEQSNGKVRVSLRSRVDCDIGTIARKLGGGGHKVAAGYTSGGDSVAGAITELKEEIIASGGSTGCR